MLLPQEQVLPFQHQRLPLTLYPSVCLYLHLATTTASTFDITCDETTVVGQLTK